MTKLTDPIAGMVNTFLKNNSPKTVVAVIEACQSEYGFVAKKGFYITFLTPKQLASHFQVSVKKLERMRADGSGPPFIKTGSKTIRYPIVGLNAWVDELIVQTTPKNDAAGHGETDLVLTSSEPNQSVDSEEGNKGK